MEIELTVREAEPGDLNELQWTGGPMHLQSLIADFALSPEERVQVVVELPSHRIVAHGVVGFQQHRGTGLIMKLTVREDWQSLGLGTLLIRSLEDVSRQHGCHTSRIAVEHDNPRAAALYRRLGFVEVGDEVDHWLEGHDRTYVTVCRVLERPLA